MLPNRETKRQKQQNTQQECKLNRSSRQKSTTNALRNILPSPQPPSEVPAGQPEVGEGVRP